MTRILQIAGGIIVLFGLGYAYYRLVYLPSQEAEQSIPRPVGPLNPSAPVVVEQSVTVNAPLSFKSIGVVETDVAPAQNPSIFFNNIQESNISSFNVLTSAGSNPSMIHYKTGFANQCHQYVWYKNWLYVYRGAEINSNTGEKTCYYKIDKSILPSLLKIIKPITSSACANFKLFISGIEYRYSETKVESSTTFSTPVTYCIYKKQ